MSEPISTVNMGPLNEVDPYDVGNDVVNDDIDATSENGDGYEDIKIAYFPFDKDMSEILKEVGHYPINVAAFEASKANKANKKFNGAAATAANDEHEIEIAFDFDLDGQDNLDSLSNASNYGDDDRDNANDDDDDDTASIFSNDSTASDAVSTASSVPNFGTQVQMNILARQVRRTLTEVVKAEASLALIAEFDVDDIASHLERTTTRILASYMSMCELFEEEGDGGHELAAVIRCGIAEFPTLRGRCGI
ncbi:hypothetical protein AJ79_09105 [Helicocarpus griseus UAMH5409]|uniref:Uncharacterized protein n=1 Tax=Helicocarpus griseus UAMH5409 TaxID=1447875 RepID=A0A2B7WE86_9EURO|nr:hypothetical protein AJ79_09105 [Helicocarpus griseus UAMH5409]